MKSEFYDLFDALTQRLSGTEELSANLQAETSSFVRFNRGLVRQPGDVRQRDFTLRLVQGRKQGKAQLSLTGVFDEDLGRCTARLQALREELQDIPDDPFLCQPDTVQSTERIGENRLPDSADMVSDIIGSVNDDDLVGILASGTVVRGFASSRGQRNWFSAHPFSLDWCQYLSGDQAVKSTYSGFDWDRSVLEAKMASARRKLQVLRQPMQVVQPGQYRTYLTPTAVDELLSLCSWGGFSASATQIGMTPLKYLASGDKQLDPRIQVSENLEGAVTEDFQESGYIRPTHIPLIEQGRLVNTLCSPRTALEYDTLTNNGASQDESPCALDMAGGDLAESDILKALDTGLYVSNLWYLNFSDKAAGRMTGMTRFATVWVENGRPVGPVRPMRFDETIYRSLGENLVALTKEREFGLSTSTYHARSTSSTRVPGALINDFTFTL